jgi:hypothetical protein
VEFVLCTVDIVGTCILQCTVCVLRIPAWYCRRCAVYPGQCRMYVRVRASSLQPFSVELLYLGTNVWRPQHLSPPTLPRSNKNTPSQKRFQFINASFHYIIHQQFDITLHHLPQHRWVNLARNCFKFRHMVCPWKNIVCLLHRGRCQTDQFTIVSHTLFCSFVPMVGVF